MYNQKNTFETRFHNTNIVYLTWTFEATERETTIKIEGEENIIMSSPHLTSLKKAKLESATRKESDIGPTVCQGCGNLSNEIPWSWHLGQLKEHTGFLVTRSLTLAPAPPRAEDLDLEFDDFACIYAKKNVIIFTTD